MLQDDREQYKLGKLASKATSKAKKSKDIDDIIGSMSKAEMENLSALEKEQLLDMQLEKYGVDAFKGNQDDIDEILRNLTPEEIKGLTQADIDMLLDMEADKLYREGKADGGMLEQSEPMESDEVMEDNYLEFVLDEALTPEEQSFLTQELEQNMQLAMIFDKVVDVAQEFAGSGPVEGPGSGVSDSIPARLSDGEFVFTAKAVEEIGADNLMAMMKDAEMKADDRQGLAEGGEPEEETVVVKGDDPVKQEIRVVKETVDSAGRMISDEDEIAKNIKSNMMLDTNQQHVRSSTNLTNAEELRVGKEYRTG